MLDEIYKSINVNVVSYLYGPMPTQPFGWFKKPIAKLDDVKGMKFRTVGLAVDMYTDDGCRRESAARAARSSRRWTAACSTAPSSTTPRRTDCSASQMSRRSACCRASTSAANSSRSLFNKTKYDALPPDLKAIIDYAVQASSADMSWKAIDRYSQDYIEPAHEGRRQASTRRPMRSCAHSSTSWDKIIDKKSAENAFFKKVLDSMKAFAERACRWQFDYNVDFRMAYNHYFGRQAAPAKRNVAYGHDGRPRGWVFQRPT